MIRAVLTDAMDVLFCGFTGLIPQMSQNAGVSESQVRARLVEKSPEFWSWCRDKDVDQDSFWKDFANKVWVDEHGNRVTVDYRVFLNTFRDNMRRTIPGTFEIYKKLVDQGLLLFMASDHVKEIVPDLVSWHPDVFKVIPKDRRYFSCDPRIRMIKGDSGFFPYVSWDIEEKYGIKKNELLFVDDNKTNISMAQENNQIKSVHFTTAEQLAEDLKAYGFEV